MVLYAIARTQNLSVHWFFKNNLFNTNNCRLLKYFLKSNVLSIINLLVLTCNQRKSLGMRQFIHSKLFVLCSLWTLRRVHFKRKGFKCISWPNNYEQNYSCFFLFSHGWFKSLKKKKKKAIPVIINYLQCTIHPLIIAVKYLSF